MGETENIPATLTKADVETLIMEHVGKLGFNTQPVAVEKTPKELKTESDAKLVAEQKKGIPLNGFLEFARFFSSQASAANRTLALGGIAIIWAFKKPEKLDPIPGLLNLPLFFLALSLTLDLLQYFFGALAWDNFYESNYKRWKRNNYPPDEVVDMVAPNSISRPIKWLFTLKILSMAVAYFFIIRFLVKKF